MNTQSWSGACWWSSRWIWESGRCGGVRGNFHGRSTTGGNVGSFNPLTCYVYEVGGPGTRLNVRIIICVAIWEQCDPLASLHFDFNEDHYKLLRRYVHRFIDSGSPLQMHRTPYPYLHWAISMHRANQLYILFGTIAQLNSSSPSSPQ